MIISLKKTLLLQVNKIYVDLSINRILNATKHNKQIILETRPPLKCNGTPQHYYHFLFDLVLPLHILLSKASSNVQFIVEAPGPFSDLLMRMFPERIILNSDAEWNNGIARYKLIGMNPNGVHIKSEVLENLKTYLSNTLNINIDGYSNRVLLIQRLPPDTFYRSAKSKNKSAGTQRRSIPNQKELKNKIESMLKPEYIFNNVQLEKMTFEDQILYFHQARLVIGQHGAGLANCIWMQNENNVIEFSNNRELTHFRIISAIKNLKHFIYKTNDRHAAIDLDHFPEWIKSQKELNKFFV
ncbi:glycosyltransferase family 61 protein [uncultured Draconibacterium sp.]|uniref:glycosyltransferase family 61 protein n=1 Tax=uncultured Draconibacterium sp. TaxID=1573823 RepID=UPI0029C6F6B4|nr:glycosyltransferase family 61 protein [uncultured Draconibacterium sp.]